MYRMPSQQSMRTAYRQIRAGFIGVVISIVGPAFCFAQTLDWEIERNFRYFRFNSDVVLHRVAAELFEAEEHHRPNASELELYLNDPGFWGTQLSVIPDAVRDAWPEAWLQSGVSTADKLIRKLRDHEPSRASVPQLGELARLGWASLLVRDKKDGEPDGGTDTCWSPVLRRHSNCGAYGDYVRPAGWVVRIFDRSKPNVPNCSWRADGGAYIAAASEAEIYDTEKKIPRVKIGAWHSPSNQSCREVRIFVPSDAGDLKKVHGTVNVVRRDGAGQETPIVVQPRDILIVGFADSFGSGEGNPEHGAIFNKNVPAIANTALPARRSPDSAAPFDRAQWTDRWCHRSVYSWQIRAALHLSHTDRHRSVTILPYGCSGAEVFEGFLYNYDGVEHTTPSKKPTGHPAQLGLAYQELCKSYYKEDQAPAIQEQPAWQTDDAVRIAASNNLAIDFSQSRKDAILNYVWTKLARCEKSGPGQFQFKRDVDALLMVGGINDIGFSKWVAGAISDKPVVTLAHGFIPRVGHPETDLRLQRLAFRYQIFREALDKRFLVDAGLTNTDAAVNANMQRVVIPLYPRGLEDESGNICSRGNQGMTAATFPGGGDAALQCEKSGPLGFKKGIFAIANVRGPVFAIRRSEDMEAIEKFREQKLNKGLIDFSAASSSNSGFKIVSSPTETNGPFAKRGFCATRDADSIFSGSKCIDFASFESAPPPSCPAGFTNDCIFKSADSMHVARGPWGTKWLGVWRPFQAGAFYPYVHRTRLFRTPNDVYLLINNRPSNALDTTLPGILDLDGRTTSGAFHPTAEAHAILAASITEALSFLKTGKSP